MVQYKLEENLPKLLCRRRVGNSAGVLRRALQKSPQDEEEPRQTQSNWIFSVYVNKKCFVELNTLMAFFVI